MRVRTRCVALLVALLPLAGVSACSSNHSPGDPLGASKVKSHFTAEDSAGALVRAQQLEVLTHENLAVLVAGPHSAQTLAALKPYLTTRALDVFAKGDAKTVSGLVPLLDSAVQFDPAGQIKRMSLSPFALESVQLADPHSVAGIKAAWEGTFAYPVISKKVRYTLTVHRKMSFQLFQDTTSKPTRWLLDNWVSSFTVDPATPRP